MAATPFDASLVPSSSFLFEIYNDGQPGVRNNGSAPPPPALPSGPCNYTDQNMPRCGCRRFWSKPAAARGGYPESSSLSDVCMCSHHACFHEESAPVQQMPPPAQTHALPAGVVNVAGQENEKPKLNREPLSPVQDLDLPSFHLQSNLGSSLDLSMINFQSSILTNPMDGAISGRLEDLNAAQESPLPDTLNWGDLIQSQGSPSHANALPPIPHQCLMQMQSQHPPSTASSSQARYLRPFAGTGLQTLSSVPGVLQGFPPDRSSDATAVEPTHDAPNRYGQPSMALTPRDGAATPKPRPSQKPGDSQSVILSGSSRSTFQELSNTVQNHEQRLNQLENTSFSVAGHEDCHEKLEHVDLRVTELESRVDEVEKFLSNDNNSVVSGRRHRRDVADDATASVVSVSTDATAQGSSRSEMYSQIQALREQVNQLQAASLPTYTQPWELEVVFLPFPLKGVWIEGKEFPNQRQSAGSDEWTQMPNTISRATPDPQTPHFGEWIGQNREPNWLLPRAFAAGRAIDQRLKSRGFIKQIAVRGSDARSIQLAINNAFGDILRVSAGPAAKSGYGVANSPFSEFLGLRQAWVPLRKIHKDSRLRFLAPAEMATATLWDYTFLVSSIVMKATGTHRLYVTQPEAYLQDHPLGYHAHESGWTWQKLRQLSRVYPDSQSSSGDVPEADAMEDCWAWNDRLDEPPTANVSSSTLSLHATQQFKQSRRSSTSPTQQFYTGVQSPILPNSPSIVRAQSPLTARDRKGSRPPHIRTNSLPVTAPILPLPSPNQSRRRVSSYSTNITVPTPYERRPSPFVPHSHSSRASPRPQTIASAMTSKRRLGTRSPALIPRNTPRWSRTSMSRSPSVMPALGPTGYFDDHRSERRTTPLCYATPHSNAPVDQMHGFRAGSSRAESRGPVIIPRDGYDPDDDENMGEDYESDGRGSSTDSESAMRDVGRRGFGGSFGDEEGNGDDADLDIYEDEPDELDAVDTDGDPGDGQLQPQDIPWAGIEDQDTMSDEENLDPHETQSISQSQSQEIEIHEDRSGFPSQDLSGDSIEGGYDSIDVEILDRPDEDGINNSLGLRSEHNDAESDVSSQPSEYPSTQQAWNLASATANGSRDGSGGGQATGWNDSRRARAVSVSMTGNDDIEFHIHEDASESSGDGSSQGVVGTRWA